MSSFISKNARVRNEGLPPQSSSSGEAAFQLPATPALPQPVPPQPARGDPSGNTAETWESTSSPSSLPRTCHDAAMPKRLQNADDHTQGNHIHQFRAINSGRRIPAPQSSTWIPACFPLVMRAIMRFASAFSPPWGPSSPQECGSITETRPYLTII